MTVGEFNPVTYSSWWQSFRSKGGFLGWWKRLWCTHNWVSHSSPQKYVGAFLPLVHDDTDFITRQGFSCRKCGGWKVVTHRYGLYR